MSTAIGNVPDGIANVVLVRGNLLHGLYAITMGPAVGGLVSSTQLMVITATAAASFSTSQALGGLTGAARDNALVLLVLLVGAFKVGFGLLRFERLTRLVSYSVMTGFLTGIATLLALSQLPTVTGYAASGGNKINQAFDVLASHW